MRRLVLEFPLSELRKIYGTNLDVSPLQKVRRLEILQVLRQDQEEMAAICKIEIENGASEIEDYFELALGNKAEVQLLDRAKDGAYVVFIKHKEISPPLTLGMAKSGVYTVSREIQEGKMILTLVGSAEQLRSVLENFGKSEVHFKVISLTDARFSTDSPLNALTEKQRRVLTTAYKLGYYNLPRKIDSEQLAKKLNLKRSTLVVHRRKAELRIISRTLTE